MRRDYILFVMLALILGACQSPSPTSTSLPTPADGTRPPVPVTRPAATVTNATPSPTPLPTASPTPTLKADGLPERWEPSGGPAGGRMEAVVVDPSTPNRLYAVGMGGAVYQSDDSGESWTPGKRLAPPSCLFSHLLIDAADPNSLYALNRCRGLFRSSDGGANWAQAQGEIDGQLAWLAHSPHAAGTLLALDQDGQIYRSRDGAASWDPISQGLPPERVRGLALSSPEIYWATTSNGANGTLYRFDGQSWYEVFFPQPAGTETSNVLVDPLDPNVLCFGLEKVDGTGFGPEEVFGFRSNDGGATWEPLQPGTAGQLGPRVDFLGKGSQSGRLYASDGRLLSSSDGGATWQQTAWPPSLAGQVPRQMAIDPSNDARLYLPLPEGGIARSQDGGQSWNRLDRGLNNVSVGLVAPHPSDPASLHAASAAGEGLFASSDHGDSWTRLTDGALGPALALAPNPHQPENLYQVSQSGQAYRSDDGGATWTAVWSDLRFNSIQALAPVPSDPSRVYANKRGFGLFRSDDGGDSWRPLTGSSVKDTSALAVHPANPDFVLSGENRQPGESAVTLRRSRDGGETWEPSLVISDGLGITSVAVDPRLELWFPRGKQPPDPTRLYAASTGPRGALWLSNDAGDSWRLVNQDLNFSNVQALAVPAHQPGVAYAAVRGGGTWYTTDSGDSWARLPNDPTGWAADIGIDASNHNVLYIADRLAPRLYRSGDGGGSWETVFDAGEGYQRLDALTLAPSDPRILFVSALKGENPVSGTLFRIDTNAPAGERATDVTSDLPGVPASLAIHRRDPRRLFATLSDGGVYKTVNDGASWRPVKTGLPEISFSHIVVDPIFPDTLYLTGEADAYTNLDPDQAYGIWKSSDDGNTWKKVGGTTFGWTSGPVTAITFQPEDQRIMYAAGQGGVYLSPDRGESWTGINGRLPFVQTQAIASDGQTLYAGSSGSGVFVGPIHPLIYTADWDRHSNLVVPIDHLEISLHPSDPQTLYVSASPGGVYKTSDGGVTWRAHNQGLSSLGVGAQAGGGHQALVAAPTAPERLYLAPPGQGVYRSDDGGGSWRPAYGQEGELQNARVETLLMHPGDPDLVYAGTEAGVWRTVDGGEIWAPFDTGLPPGLGVRSLALGQVTTTTLRLYAGSHGYGVYRREAVQAEGTGWQQTPPMNQEGPNQASLLFHPSDSNVLYLATSPAGVYKTSDGGESWHEQNVGLGTGGVLSLIFHPEAPQILYAGTPAGIMHSVDGGESWAPWAVGWPTQRRVLSIAIDPSDPSILYACAHQPESGSSLMKSSDGGLTWSEILVGLDPTHAFYQVLVDRFDPQAIYLATGEQGVYLSRDGGGSWVSWNEGLWNRVAGGHQREPSAALRLSADGRILYFGTSGSGVWRRPAAGWAQPEE